MPESSAVEFTPAFLRCWISVCGDKSSAAVKLHKTAEPNASKNTEGVGGKGM